MESFLSSSESQLTYTRTGTGRPLICVPGGPLLTAEYLGDLGGLDRHAELVLFNPPGSIPDASLGVDAYRCDNVAEDLEALRQHLGLERLDLFGHSAGANIVLRYAEYHPERVSRLVLVTPSTRAVGIEITDEARSEVARSRATEPWFDDAFAALGRIRAQNAVDSDWDAITPFSYGRWDADAQIFDARMEASRNLDAAARFGAAGAFDPPVTRSALGKLRAPVTVLAGGIDIRAPIQAMEELTDIFPTGELLIQPDAGHFPWIDDPAAFVALLAPHRGSRCL